jgi:hypothetical protein
MGRAQEIAVTAKQRIAAAPYNLKNIFQKTQEIACILIQSYGKVIPA